jgi:hypothetical protein
VSCDCGESEKPSKIPSRKAKVFNHLEMQLTRAKEFLAEKAWRMSENNGKASTRRRLRDCKPFFLSFRVFVFCAHCFFGGMGALKSEIAFLF